MKNSIKNSVKNIALTGWLLTLWLPAQAEDVDPFTGQTLAIEQTRAMVELTKEQNDLLDEQTKKAHAEFMLKNSDKVFAAELHKQLEQSNGGGYGGYSGGYPTAKFPEPEHGKKNKASKDIALPMLPVMPQLPAMPSGPRLMGVVRQAGSRVAMIDNMGDVIYAKQGDNVAGIGVVSAIGDSQAMIGGRMFAVQALAVSDVDKQDIKQFASQAMNPSGVMGAHPASASQNGMSSQNFSQQGFPQLNQ